MGNFRMILQKKKKSLHEIKINWDQISDILIIRLVNQHEVHFVDLQK